MKKFKIFILLNLILILFTSCGTVKDGFTNQKKKSNDEFLVEKKSPLIMPPNFDELPKPSGSSLTNNNNDIKNLISKPKKDSSKKSNSGLGKSLENSMIDKIKTN